MIPSFSSNPLCLIFPVDHGNIQLVADPRAFPGGRIILPLTQYACASGGERGVEALCKRSRRLFDYLVMTTAH
jgi:hypothetical protein